MEHNEPSNEVHTSLLTVVDKELAYLHEDIAILLNIRHQLFDLPHSQITAENLDVASSGLYDEPTYNNSFIQEDISLRGGGSREFHEETENYNPDPSDSPELAEKKRTYRKAVLHIAQKHGFVAEHPGEATSALDRELGILDSTLTTLAEPVDVIVAGAAGKSNILRVRDTIRNIESGAVKTNHVILTGCERPVSEKEREGLSSAGFRGGETEFDSLCFAAEDLFNITLEQPKDTLRAPYGEDLHVTTREGIAVINGQEIRITALSAPFNPKRMVNDRPANRANTEETFLAAAPLLNEDNDVLIESHDTWVPYQKTIGQLTLGVEFGKTVYATGPLKADRVFYNKDGEIDLKDAQGVVDEIAKVYNDLTRTRIALASKKIFRT